MYHENDYYRVKADGLGVQKINMRKSNISRPHFIKFFLKLFLSSFLKFDNGNGIFRYCRKFFFHVALFFRPPVQKLVAWNRVFFDKNKKKFLNFSWFLLDNGAFRIWVKLGEKIFCKKKVKKISKNFWQKIFSPNLTQIRNAPLSRRNHEKFEIFFYFYRKIRDSRPPNF